MFDRQAECVADSFGVHHAIFERALFKDQKEDRGVGEKYLPECRPRKVIQRDAAAAKWNVLEDAVSELALSNDRSAQVASDEFATLKLARNTLHADERAIHKSDAMKGAGPELIGLEAASDELAVYELGAGEIAPIEADVREFASSQHRARPKRMLKPAMAERYIFYDTVAEVAPEFPGHGKKI
jgi:hypothetical protein